MKRAAAVVIGLLVGALLVAEPSDAATTSVGIQSFGFNPRVVTVAQGSTVQWNQMQALVQHTSTSDQHFWASRLLANGDTYRQTAAFENAGSYPYHCTVHPEMTGTVRVPMKLRGSAGSGWTLRWSSLSSTPANRAFDVQIKRPGATTWAAFRSATARRTAFFDPARTGTYHFRARTRNLTNGKHSGWSPLASPTVA